MKRAATSASGRQGRVAPLHVVGGANKIFIELNFQFLCQLQLGNPSGKETSFAYLANVKLLELRQHLLQAIPLFGSQGVGLYSSLVVQNILSIANASYAWPKFLGRFKWRYFYWVLC